MIMVPEGGIPGSTRCSWCLDLKHCVRKAASNVLVEAGALGVGPQQIMVDPEGNTDILIRSSVAELYLQNGSKAIVGDLRQRRGSYRHGIHHPQWFGASNWHLGEPQALHLDLDPGALGYDGFQPIQPPNGSIHSALEPGAGSVRSRSESGAAQSQTHAIHCGNACPWRT